MTNKTFCDNMIQTPKEGLKNMKNILIHCAMKKEGEQIARLLNLVEKKKKEDKFNNIITTFEGKQNETKITLIVTGIGKQKTAIGLTKYLCENDKPDLIINIGYAGSTSAKIGSWVSINKSYNLEWDITGEQKYSMDDLGGQDLVIIEELEKLPCYSAECFVNNTDIKENVIFDMELHSVSLLADLYNIPLISLKKVSDNLSMDDYYKTVEDNKLMELESSIKYIEKFLKEK